MKTVGKRNMAQTPENAFAFLKFVADLTQGCPFIPKGIYRFKSFTEAQNWSIKMMARKTRDHRN